MLRGPPGPALARVYGERIEALLPQIIKSVAEFDSEFREVEGEDRGYYASDADPRYQMLPYNHATAIGRTYVMLWLLTGEKRFRRRAALIARDFRAALRTTEDRYDWPMRAIHHVSSPVAVR